MARGNKDALEPIRVAEAQGFRVRRTSKGYLVYAKDPSLGVVSAHRTPSDPRAERNLRAQLRRIGVEL